MEDLKIESLSFKYSGSEKYALQNINLTVKRGEFITICGKSGCGKTTLLRLLKPAIAPFGEISGNIFSGGVPLGELDARAQAERIGFVMQNPDNQLVTDKVWHELAFGAESLGLTNEVIRTRVSEMASFFAIQSWFHKKVADLSGGQKQLLNLASVMVMQPSVLILDEPTSQLDPIAAQEFITVLEKINRETGTTVILTEHRLEEALDVSDRVIVMDGGKIIADAPVGKIGGMIKNHDMYSALPSPMRIYGAVENKDDYPITVRDGRRWLEDYSRTHELKEENIPKPENSADSEAAIELSDCWFRYEKNLPDVIKGLNLKVKKGEIYAIVGGNGAGKTTALSLASALNRPYRGKVYINGGESTQIKNLCGRIVGVLPQNPQTLFVKKTVYLDLAEMLSDEKISAEEKKKRALSMARLCRIDELLQRHPYDLSGGEQQRAALAKVLLKEPEILLLDEPTKGMDALFKEKLGEILKALKKSGVTVLMVSHDIEFCAEYADRCGMFFDGKIVSEDNARSFFIGNNFYTTSANRMARGVLPSAVTADDVILACGGSIKKIERNADGCLNYRPGGCGGNIRKKERDAPHFDGYKKALPEKKAVAGEKKRARILPTIFFAALFIITSIMIYKKAELFHLSKQVSLIVLQLAAIAEISGALYFLFPQRKDDINSALTINSDYRPTGRASAGAFLALIAIPLTIYFGVYFLGDRKYYFISLLIILEAMIPFFAVFEGRRPQAREIVIISALCALAVAGRAAFYMLPEFKPVAAIVIISGVCFGGEAGFLVGAVSAFVSNFFFGQGAWTPWQMFSFGIIGFLSGVLFRKGFLRNTKLSLCIFGFVSVFVIYGGIMNASYVIQSQSGLTRDMFLAAYLSGAPFDFIHGASTAFFLWFISEEMIEKLERIKIKYGLIKTEQ